MNKEQMIKIANEMSNNIKAAEKDVDIVLKFQKERQEAIDKERKSGNQLEKRILAGKLRIMLR